MHDAVAIQGIEVRYAALAPLMDVRLRRQWAAAEPDSCNRRSQTLRHSGPVGHRHRQEFAVGVHRDEA